MKGEGKYGERQTGSSIKYCLLIFGRSLFITEVVHEVHTVIDILWFRIYLLEDVGTGTPKIQNVQCVAILPVSERLGDAYDFLLELL